MATQYYCTIDLSYNANGGSGAPSAQSVTETVNSFPANVYLRLSSKTPTRTGYTFMGWAISRTSSTADYETGGLYAHTFTSAGTWTITLYAVWKENANQSTITSITSPVPIDGTTTGTLVISRSNTSYLHQVVISFGSYSQTFNNVGQGQSGNTVSMTFTIPTAWLSGLPNSTSGTATCTVKTFNGSSLVGSSVSKTFTITVPSTVKPSVTLSGTNQSSNSTVSGWGILLQGYSTIRLSASASAGQGATVTNISFSGDGVSASGTATSTTSELLTTTGSRTWRVTVTDSRGRSASDTITRTVYSYNSPSASLTAFRSTNAGVADDTAGTYINAKATFSYASCNGNNTVTANIQYKQHTVSSWTNGKTGAASGTAYTFGGGNVSILYSYDVRVVVTDALGNSATRTASVASASGYSFGLNGKSVRFGGPIQYDDKFENDFEYLGHGNATISKASGTTGATGFLAERTDTGARIIMGVGTDGYSHGIFSYRNNEWIICKSQSGNTLINSAPYLAGHNSAIGTIKTENLSSSTTIATGTNKAVVSITLAAGTWIIVARARFSANATGYRHINISTTSADSGAHVQVPAVSGAVTQLALTRIVTHTANTTYYLNAYQNSGSSLTMAAGSGGEINALTAIRIL